ncbi:MAG: hypothetical protein IPK16_01560 [Anaerolineales bacterium]|nr:hypothetical protein [Anaerolineales bacterium]
MNHGLAVTATFALSGTPLVRALNHLDRVMDQYHDTLDVYTDLGAAGNHFAHRGAMGIAPGIVDEAYTGTVHSGATSIRALASGGSIGVAGIFRMAF